MTLGTDSKDGSRALREVVAKYETPSLPRSLRQIANTILPYCALLCLMYFSLDVSYWITLALSIPAAGFLTRNFIIFHDCGHGSFFKSKRANRALGFFSALLTFTPSSSWSRQHASHHANAGDLDHRGEGDIWTVTVQEYIDMPRWKRACYRTYRNPLFLFVVAPLYLFFVHYRYGPGNSARSRWSTIRTNLALVGIMVGASLTIGFKTYVMIQLPIMIVTGSVGMWLFYVQHQFENTYWDRHDEWSYVRQAIEGSSFYKLPRVLQWFSGNIGFHHVHHLSPRIPNYNLQACHESHTMFQAVPHVTLWASLKTLGYRLWDEDNHQLVGFNYLPVHIAKQQIPVES